MGIVPTNLDQPETAVALGAHHVTDDGTSLRTEHLAGAVPQQQVPQQQWWTPNTPAPPGPSPTPKRARRKRWSWKKVGIAGAVLLVVAAIGLATWRVIAIMTPQGLPATGKAPPPECALSGDTLRALHITNVQDGDTREGVADGVRSETTCKSFPTRLGGMASAEPSVDGAASPVGSPAGTSGSHCSWSSCSAET